MHKVLYLILTALTLFLNSCGGSGTDKASGTVPEPELIAFTDFSDINKLASPYWSYGAKNGGTLTFENGYAEGSYPALTKNGDVYVWLSCKVYKFEGCDDLLQIFIEFDAQMPGPIRGGLKFCKVFGQDRYVDPENIGTSNCTFQLNYETGAFYKIGFGDGSFEDNDFQNIIALDSLANSYLGRSPSPEIDYYGGNNWVETDWGEGWHHFRLMVKFNDGTTAENEVPNGEFYVEIDGIPYVKAKNLFNRSYKSSPIQSVGFFNQAQSEGHPGFLINYDNIKISKYGFTK